jgi:hypothetical protein
VNIDKKLAEIEAVRSGLGDLIAHGRIEGEDAILVSLRTLRRLNERIRLLREDLHEAAVAHANDTSRKRLFARGIKWVADRRPRRAPPATS